MLCLISLIFIILIVSQLEADIISNTQAIIYGAYGILMLYHTSKPYWTENQEKDQKKRTNQDHQAK